MSRRKRLVSVNMYVDRAARRRSAGAGFAGLHGNDVPNFATPPVSVSQNFARRLCA